MGEFTKKLDNGKWQSIDGKEYATRSGAYKRSKKIEDDKGVLSHVTIAVIGLSVSPLTEAACALKALASATPKHVTRRSSVFC